MLGLQRIDRPRHARLHVAECTSARAGVAKDHHRRVLLGPALADVRAGCFFANRREVERAHQLAYLVIAFADGRLHPNPVGLALLWRYGCWSVHARADSDWSRRLPPLHGLASAAHALPYPA